MQVKIQALSLTNRSLWLAILSCLAMYFYAKAPLYLPGASWESAVFFFAVLAISGWGLYFGVRGARGQNRMMAWLAPVINGFIIVTFLSFYFLTVWRMGHMR